MDDLDAAITLAVVLATETKTDLSRRKRAKWSKIGFFRVRNLDTQNYYVNRDTMSHRIFKTFFSWISNHTMVYSEWSSHWSENKLPI